MLVELGSFCLKLSVLLKEELQVSDVCAVSWFEDAFTLSGWNMDAWTLDASSL